MLEPIYEYDQTQDVSSGVIPLADIEKAYERSGKRVVTFNAQDNILIREWILVPETPMLYKGFDLMGLARGVSNEP